MAQWDNTQYPGVRYREHASRKHNGRPDRYFAIRYKRGAKRVEEPVGWSSEQMNATKANAIRATLVKNIREGRSPQSLKEMRQIEENRRLDEQERLEAEKRDSLTLGEFMEKHYLPWADENKKRARDDRSLYKVWLAPDFAATPMRDISPLDVERLKKKMREDGKAEATVKHALVLIRQAFNKAKSWKIWYGENPIKGVKIPKLENDRLRFLTPEEADFLLKLLQVKSQQLFEIATFSLYGGMRLGEVLGLTWGNIDFNNNIIRILNTKGKSSRPVFITEPIMEILKRMRSGNPDDLLFKNRKNNKIQWLSKTFREVVEESGINNGVTERRERVCFHTLRHTYASWAVMQGIPIYVVSKALGHKTTTMTQRYAHLAPQSQKMAFEAVLDFSNLRKW